MEKLDLKKEHKELFKASDKKFQIVDVPELNYVMIDGQGDPGNSQEFQRAVEALFGLTYTLKFQLKAEDKDFAVMPMEGTWWTDDMTQFSMDHREIWKWTLMILVPDYVSQKHFKEAKEALRKKKNPSSLDGLRLEKTKDGLSAQILYIGPYKDEPPTIQRLHQFIEDQGYRLHKKHREIYLSDMRKTAPEKLKTIIRQPMTR
jgi:hypothetical protein